MSRHLLVALAVCLMATTATFAQTGLNGKWATDRPADPLEAEAQRKQRVQLDLYVEGDTASGGLSIGGLGGTFHSFKDAKLSGNKVQFRIPTGPDPSYGRTYTIELVDENTVRVRLSPLELVGTGVLNLLSTPPNSPRPAPANFPPPPVPQNAPLAGTVTDVSGALIPGVTITATNTETGSATTVSTDASGVYAFPNLQTGKAYRVSASLPGFQTSVADVEVATAPARQNFQLAIAVRVDRSGTSCAPTNIEWCVVLHRSK